MARTQGGGASRPPAPIRTWWSNLNKAERMKILGLVSWAGDCGPLDWDRLDIVTQREVSHEWHRRH